jgi:hypothetical protein
MVTKVWLWLFLGVSLTPQVGWGSQWTEQAEAEKKMVWYTTIGSADAKMLVDEFRRRYPKSRRVFPHRWPSAGGAHLY